LFFLLEDKKDQNTTQQQPKKEDSHAVANLPDNTNSIKIDPSIFISLKKGNITNTYKVGNILGEGIILLFLNFFVFKEEK